MTPVGKASYPTHCYRGKTSLSRYRTAESTSHGLKEPQNLFYSLAVLASVWSRQVDPDLHVLLGEQDSHAMHTVSGTPRQVFTDS
jgi:hypothetical protein